MYKSHSNEMINQILVFMSLFCFLFLLASTTAITRCYIFFLIFIVYKYSVYLPTVKDLLVIVLEIISLCDLLYYINWSQFVISCANSMEEIGILGYYSLPISPQLR
uniref:Uncharacterized protein n=1 Tax=Micrurus surinamensis TaxID=129470 RepID=A0A2D4Q891_MICSU